MRERHHLPRGRRRSAEDRFHLDGGSVLLLHLLHPGPHVRLGGEFGGWLGGRGQVGELLAQISRHLRDPTEQDLRSGRHLRSARQEVHQVRHAVLASAEVTGVENAENICEREGALHGITFR